MAFVRTCGGNRNPEQAFDAYFRAGVCTGFGRVASACDAADAVDLAWRIHRNSDFSPELALGDREPLADDRDSSECRSHEECARDLGAIHSSTSLPRPSP